MCIIYISTRMPAGPIRQGPTARGFTVDARIHTFSPIFFHFRTLPRYGLSLSTDKKFGIYMRVFKTYRALQTDKKKSIQARLKTLLSRIRAVNNCWICSVYLGLG